MSELKYGIPDDHEVHDDMTYSASSTVFYWHRERWRETIAKIQQKYDGSNIHIGVLDTGSPMNHTLLDEKKTRHRRDYTREDSQARDNNGHGGHVHGIISGLTGMGLAIGATVSIYKVLGAKGSGSTRGINDAIVQAGRDGCDIINMSIGSVPGAERREDQEAVDLFYKEGGKLAIAAAGNSGQTSPNRTTIGPPGSLNNILTIGSTKDNDDNLSRYSSSGPKLDFVCPGQNIISVNSKTRSQVIGMSGTSMACPNFVGAEALIRQHRRRIGLPDLIGVEATIKYYRENGLIIDLQRPGRDTNTGEGILHLGNVFNLLLDLEPDWSWTHGR